MLDKNIKPVSILFKEDFKVCQVRKNLCNFLIDNRKFLLDNVVGDTVRVHSPHIKVIGCELLTKFKIVDLLFFNVYDLLFQGADEAMKRNNLIFALFKRGAFFRERASKCVFFCKECLKVFDRLFILLVCVLFGFQRVKFTTQTVNGILVASDLKLDRCNRSGSFVFILEQRGIFLDC